MERRRKQGLVAMGAGVVFALAGELTSRWTAAGATFAVLATLCLLGGGIAVALSYREEAGVLPGRSRLFMLATSRGGAGHARRGDAPKKGGMPLAGSDPTSEQAQLHAYAIRFNEALSACEELLTSTPTASDVEDARERLMILVASPRYGDATRRGLVDEARVREVSGRLAAAL